MRNWITLGFGVSLVWFAGKKFVGFMGSFKNKLYENACRKIYERDPDWLRTVHPNVFNYFDNEKKKKDTVVTGFYQGLKDRLMETCVFLFCGF